MTVTLAFMRARILYGTRLSAAAVASRPAAESFQGLVAKGKLIQASRRIAKSCGAPRAARTERIARSLQPSVYNAFMPPERPDYKSHPLWNEAMALARAAYAVAEEVSGRDPEEARRLRQAAVSVPAKLAGALAAPGPLE
jgi:hypothetical protein